MNGLKSTIFSENKPLDDGLDLALIFAQQNHDSITKFVQNRDSSISSLKTQIDQQKQELEKLKKSTLTIIVAGAVISLVLGIVMKFWLAIIGFIGVAAYYFFVLKPKEKQFNVAINDLENQLKNVENSIPPQVVNKLGKLNTSLETLPFENSKIIVDNSGLIQDKSIVFSEFNKGFEKIQTLKTLVAKFDEEFPVLLPPDDDSSPSSGDDFNLTGIEKDTQEMLKVMYSLMKEQNKLETSIPVLDSDSSLIKIINNYSDHITNELNSAHTIINRVGNMDQVISSLQKSNKQLQEIKKLGMDSIETLIVELNKKISDNIVNMENMRGYSLINMLVKDINEISPVYDYPLTRFYNPNISGYRNVKNEFSPDEFDVDNINYDNIKNFYKADIMEKLVFQYKSINESLNRMTDADIRKNEEMYNYNKVKLNKIKNLLYNYSCEVSPEQNEQMKHYRNAVLKYNTTSKKWFCQLTEESFSHDEAKNSRLLKVRDDLIIPIWDKLWLEKHDEKNRIIREKELELRNNVEKENSQIRDEVKLFTEEMRPIRNDLMKYAVGLDTGQKKLNMTLDFMVARSILSNDKTRELKNMISHGSGISADEVTETSDLIEKKLEGEPDLVLIYRGSLKDHVDEVRETNKFFLPGSKDQQLLAGSGSEIKLLNSNES